MFKNRKQGDEWNLKKFDIYLENTVEINVI